MEAFLGKWKMDYDACEGYDEFMTAEGTPADVLAQMKTHDCVISFREKDGEGGTYVNNINFVGMYDVGDEEFILGKENTVEVPETGDKVTNLMELTDDGALKTTTKKGNGVNIRMMKVEGDSIMTENVLTLKDGTEIVSKEKFNKIE